MKKIKRIVFPIVVFGILMATSAYINNASVACINDDIQNINTHPDQSVNLFVTHGHCSTPFAGIISDLNIHIPERSDQGNPLENLVISFEIDPNSFNVCASETATARVKTPGLFVSPNNDKMIFKSTNIYTMGLDWYQVNGMLSIKGIERNVKFFATGIRDMKDAQTRTLILEGQMNLLDWGIDYDKIVSGKSDPVPTKWMHINMKFDLS